jgi:hypothetical protein
MNGPVSSIAPRALRGVDLRFRLAELSLANPGFTESTAEEPVPEECQTADAPIAASGSCSDAGPQSEGPRALRPHEIALWRANLTQ